MYSGAVVQCSVIPDDVGPLALAIASRFYSGTWFSQDYLEGVVKTSLGCMAGTPPADIVYAMAFARNTQFGSGFNGGETAFAHLYLRLFSDI